MSLTSSTPWMMLGGAGYSVPSTELDDEMDEFHLMPAAPPVSPCTVDDIVDTFYVMETSPREITSLTCDRRCPRQVCYLCAPPPTLLRTVSSTSCPTAPTDEVDSAPCRRRAIKTSINLVAAVSSRHVRRRRYSTPTSTGDNRPVSHHRRRRHRTHSLHQPQWRRHGAITSAHASK